jgi:hypothetical protein
MERLQPLSTVPWARSQTTPQLQLQVPLVVLLLQLHCAAAHLLLLLLASGACLERHPRLRHHHQH